MVDHVVGFGNALAEGASVFDFPLVHRNRADGGRRSANSPPSDRRWLRAAGAIERAYLLSLRKDN
jgi:hypothetical protein